MQRIREGFMGNGPQLSGIVEVDETYVGCKQKNRHKSQQDRYSGEDAYRKRPVVSAVERGGKVVAMPIRTPDGNTLTRFVESAAKHGSTVYAEQEPALYSIIYGATWEARR